jgi:hypothetical protein
MIKTIFTYAERFCGQPTFPHLTFRRLDGDTPSVQRHAVVTNFNENPTIDMLLLTTSVGGLGLNLTGSLIIITLLRYLLLVR